MTPLEAARVYAQRGWPVFPIQTGAKVPATKRGLLDASTDVAIIEKWWTYRKDWETRNVAVVTSRQSGIWVLDEDVDAETGELIGEATLKRLVEKHGELPPHAIAKTPKGGRHHVFAYPDDGLDLPRKIKFAPGLDALGSRSEDGVEKAGYFLVYPSVRPDGSYKWEVPPSQIGRMPQAPQWLLDLIRSEPISNPPPPPSRSDGTSTYGRAALDEESAAIASCPPGQQDDNFVRCATRIGSLVAGHEIDEHEALSTLVSAGMRMVNSERPWTLRELESKAKRCFSHAAKNPRQKRPRPVLQLIQGTQIKEQPTPAPPQPWSMGLPWALKPDGTIRPKEHINCQLMIEHHPDLVGVIDYDEFCDQMLLTRGLPGDARSNYPRLLADEDVTEWAAWLNRQGISPNFDTVQRFMHAWAKKNGRDPLKEYLNGLKWDGKTRLDTWLTYYCGAEANDYVKAVGRKFMIGAAARGLIPGSKVDSMLIWEGIQGIGKSSGARALFGDRFFSDQIADVRNKEGAISLQGIWCIEVAEMDKFGRVEANAVKSFLTHNEDRYRPHYGRHMIARPRRCVFLGTINPDGTGYLRDPTGNRRFWPVTVTSIDVEGLRLDRDQLWAEAVVALRAGEKHWLDEDQERLAVVEQEARQEDELREPEVIEWVENQRMEDGVFAFTVAECLKGVGITGAHQNSREANGVRRIVKKMGCVSRSNWANRKGRFWVHRRIK